MRVYRSPRAIAWFTIALVTLPVILLSGCGPTVDLKKSLQVKVIETGWFDAGIINGQNKLVPSITFTLTNQSDQKLVVLQANSIFRRVSDPNGEWGSGFKTIAGADGLAPGGETAPITIRSQLGYTGTESRLEMLQNSKFVDAKIDLFSKYGSTQWAKLGEYPIERKLLTQ
jgi:hypothetical protein